MPSCRLVLLACAIALPCVALERLATWGDGRMRQARPLVHVAAANHAGRVVTADGETLVIWHLTRGLALSRVPAGGPVHAVGLSGDGTRFAAVVQAAEGLSVKVWNTASGRAVKSLPLTRDPQDVAGVRLSHDGRFVEVSTRSSGLAGRWDVETGDAIFTDARLQRIFPESQGIRVFSATGAPTVLAQATRSTGPAAGLFSTETLRSLLRLDPLPQPIVEASRGLELAVDAAGRVLELEGGEVRREGAGAIDLAAFAPDGSWVAEAGPSGARLVGLSGPPRTVALRSGVQAFQTGFTKDYVVARYGVADTEVVRVDDGAIVARPLQGRPGRVLLFCGDSSLITALESGALRVHRRGEPEEDDLREGLGAVTSIAVQPSGRDVLVGDAGGVVRRIVRATGEVTWATLLPSGRVEAVRWEGDLAIAHTTDATFTLDLLGKISRTRAPAPAPTLVGKAPEGLEFEREFDVATAWTRFETETLVGTARGRVLRIAEGHAGEPMAAGKAGEPRSQGK